MDNIRRLYHSLYPGYLREFLRELKGIDSILDVGCGANSPLQYVNKSGRRVGLDGFAPSIEKAKQKGIHTQYLEADFRDMSTLFNKNEFECVLANDVIEHLTRDEGFNLLDTIENIASKKVIIFTPVGFVPQRSFDRNDLQEHLSGWEVEDFYARGYRVRGINGLAALRGERAAIKHKPAILFSCVSWASQFYTFSRPKKAYAQFCVLEK